MTDACETSLTKADLYVASAVRLTPEQWQRALDDMNLIVRIVLDPRDVEPMSGTIRATLDGEPTSFSFEERPPTQTVREAGFSHLFATPVEGPVKPTVTAHLAALAYLIGSKGAGYDPDRGIHYPPKEPPKDLWRHLDTTLAIFCGKDAECRARYPDEFEDPSDPTAVQMVVISRLAD